MRLKELLFSYAKRLRKSDPFGSKEEKELFYLKVGATIRKIRKVCGFTQGEFAHIIESKQTVLSAVEKGKYKGNVYSVLEAICKVFYPKEFVSHGYEKNDVDRLIGTLPK